MPIFVVVVLEGEKKAFVRVACTSFGLLGSLVSSTAGIVPSLLMFVFGLVQ